ncbi:MAG: gliding motility-associated C-terminal domain-containing protein [Sphaerospermopsis sp.]|nr:gliding motility-associated C-terminal domain-containing protein [Sphaerospermopsis sp.]
MRIFIFLILAFLSFFTFAQPCGSGGGGSLPIPTKCFEIVSILVDACDGNNEGQNEMIRLKIGSNPLLISGFSVPAFVTGNANWGAGSSNLWRGFCNYNASSLAKIASINAAITNAGRCGKLIPLNNNQSVPANGELLIITSTDFNPTAQSFTNLMDTLYVVLQCSGNTAGHFANHGTSSTRRLILNHTSCSDTVIYNRVNLLKQDQTLGAEDGGAVNFSYSGGATYVNNGCAIPITPIIFDAGTTNLNYCPNQSVNLSGTVTGTNCYFWEAKNKGDGSYSDSSILNPVFTISSNASGLVTLYLKINNACGQTKDSVSFLVGSNSSNIYAGNDTILCSGSSISFNPTISTGSVKWYTTGLGTFSNSNQANTIYSPSNNEFGNTKIILELSGSCGKSFDTLNVNFIAKPNPNFTTPSGQICKGSAPFAIVPIINGGQFYGSYLTGNLFNPLLNGNFTIKYVVGNSGCLDSSVQTISVSDLPNPNFTLPVSSICAGSKAILLTPSTTGGIFSGIGIVGNTFDPTTGGNYSIKYVITNGTCKDSASRTIQVFDKPVPTFSPTATRVCEGSPLIPLNPFAAGGNFTGSQYITGNQFNPQWPGTYTLVHTVQENGCVDSSTQQILVDQKPNPNFTLEDTLFCEGDSPVDLTPLEQGGTFENNGNILSNGRFSPSKFGLFNIKYKISIGTCTDSSQKMVRVIENPISSFIFSPQIALVNEPVQFTYTGKGATGFEWEFGNPIFGTSILQNPLFAFPKSGQFSVKLTVQNELCFAESIQEITINDADSLFVPNVFTPNSDSLNDSFGAVGHGIKEYSMMIYNRWGDLLYTSYHINHKWDGTFHEKDCPDGVYFFIINATSNRGRKYNLSGTVHLIR